MPRDRLFIEEMIDSATRAIDLTTGIDLDALEADRTRLDALLWNFTVLGEAATQVSAETKDLYGHVHGNRTTSRVRRRASRSSRRHRR